MTSDTMPACVCSAHPKNEDRSKYMFVVECTSEFVVFCCKRCSEILHDAVIQVRTLAHARDRARYTVAQQRQQMDPRLLRMLNARKKGGVRVKEADHD